uniref:Uncharacterized protein n=1 Tax=Romanomermis culicivorax TaxID=13658 RepID=A0A915JY76_ROMCU
MNEYETPSDSAWGTAAADWQAAEKDRGQSIAEFSVGGRRPRAGSQSSDWGETYGAYSQPRAVSEYTVGDLASISEESQYSTSTDLQQDLYDKKILLKKSHDFQPDAKGSSERFKNEISTKIVKSGTRQL